MGEHQPSDPRRSALATDVHRAGEHANDLHWDIAGVGGLRQEEVGVPGQLDQFLGWAAVARVHHRSHTDADSDAHVGSRVRK